VLTILRRVEHQAPIARLVEEDFMTQEDWDGCLEFLDAAYDVQVANSLCTRGTVLRVSKQTPLAGRQVVAGGGQMRDGFDDETDAANRSGGAGQRRRWSPGVDGWDRSRLYRFVDRSEERHRARDRYRDVLAS
jgi:hypothetical protein